MATEYRTLCDICNKETKGFGINSLDNKEVAKNDFHLRVDNHWLEDEGEHKRLLHDTKLELDLCAGCTVRLVEHIKNIVKDMKKNAQ